ncbi:MAG: hypothetical protein L0211_23550, partial [Planctomycetaceae bacterium]|nr:hypothetical protein [Planctomycetaceae bacterium]
MPFGSPVQAYFEPGVMPKEEGAGFVVHRFDGGFLYVNAPTARERSGAGPRIRFELTTAIHKGGSATAKV